MIAAPPPPRVVTVEAFGDVPGARESVYPAWCPPAGRRLGFGDARETVDPVAGTFRARVLIDGPLRELTGRYVMSGGLIGTAPAAGRG